MVPSSLGTQVSPSCSHSVVLPKVSILKGIRRNEEDSKTPSQSMSFFIAISYQEGHSVSSMWQVVRSREEMSDHRLTTDTLHAVPQKVIKVSAKDAPIMPTIKVFSVQLELVINIL